jgi:hypothetical protein
MGGQGAMNIVGIKFWKLENTEKTIKIKILTLSVIRDLNLGIC